MRWFDLSPVGGKLERVMVEPGHHVLRLYLASSVAEETNPETVEMYGWLGKGVSDDGRIQFENHRSILRATDVAQCLQAFYSEDVIRDAYTPAEKLGQGERIDGLKTRSEAKLSDFEQEMLGVDPSDLDRIRRSILAAQHTTSELLNANGRQPLGGRGYDFIRKMEAAGHGELGAAAVWVATAGRTYVQLEQMIDRVAASESVDLGDVDLLSGMVPDAAITSVDDHVTAERRFDEVMSNGQAPSLSHILGFLRAQVPVRAMESGFESGAVVKDLETRLGMNVRRDNSLPTRQYEHALVAISRGMEAIAEGLNKEIEAIVPNQQDVVLRISRGKPAADEKTLARQTSVAGGPDEEDLGRISAISVSGIYGGAFIHEFGHLVDENHGLSKEERRDLLEQSGVRGRVLRSVRLAIEDGKIDEKTGDYYRDDAEIFARTFEAAFVNRALKNGDTSLSSIGGFSAAFPGDSHAPVGDHQLTEQFLSSLNELLDRKQTLKHERKNAALVANEP